MIKICFVCLGNICRSPMAEALMRDEIKQRGWEQYVTVDSHATGTWNLGNAPHHGTQQILNQVGVSFEGQYATQLTQDNSQNYDYLIGMNDSNITDMRFIVGEEPTLYRLLDFTDQPGEIPDPYFTGDFEETYDLISTALASLCAYLKKAHHLP